MIKRAVFLHDDHYVANFVNSIVIACILASCGNGGECGQNRRRSYHASLSSFEACPSSSGRRHAGADVSPSSTAQQVTPQIDNDLRSRVPIA
jgi:hypothetical protein